MLLLDIVGGLVPGDSPDRQNSPPNAFSSAVLESFFKMVPISSLCKKGIIANDTILASIRKVSDLARSSVCLSELPGLNADVCRASNNVKPEQDDHCMPADVTLFKYTDCSKRPKKLVSVSQPGATMLDCTMFHSRRIRKFHCRGWEQAASQVIYIDSGFVQEKTGVVPFVQDIHSGNDAPVNARLQALHGECLLSLSPPNAIWFSNLTCWGLADEKRVEVIDGTETHKHGCALYINADALRWAAQYLFVCLSVATLTDSLLLHLTVCLFVAPSHCRSMNAGGSLRNSSSGKATISRTRWKRSRSYHGSRQVHAQSRLD